MNRGILQTDYRLYRAINKTGCAFRCIGAAIEDLSGKYLTSKDINEVYDRAVDLRHITDTCQVNSWKGLIDLYSAALGVKYRGYDIGLVKPLEAPVYWGWVENLPEGMKPEANYIMQKWTAAGPDGTHFTLGTPDGKMIFDSWPVPGVKNLLHSVLIHIKEV
jgi:hypothetical protein